MNKNAIKKFAIDARNKLIASVTDKAGMLGITPDNCSEAITKGSDFEVYKTAAGTEVTLNKKQCEQRRKLVAKIHEKGFEAVVEEVAYTWFNRICAIRFMEVNDYMYPVRVRVLSSEKEGKNEPDVVTMAPDIDWDFTDKEREEIIDAKMNNRLDDLFRMLFIKQCNLLHEVLPGLFEETEDYTEMLLNISFTNEDDVIRMLVDEKRGIPEEDFNVNTIGEDGQPTGQVEIIGWLYQYYNTELKDDTFAKLKKNVKITKERIPAATQLFTPDWIVRYMVENSVGRIWIEHLRAVDSSIDEKATAERFGWKYYLPEAEQEESVNVKLAEIRTTYKDLKPTDITCIDPCMGSGHILIAMFDVLMDIYESAGYDKREAAFDIVENNIHGLDIDQRAYQLAYFAVMMKGRGYNRRFLRGRDAKPEPKVYAIIESNDIEKRHLRFFGTSMPEIERIRAEEQMIYLLYTFVDAREYGSILNVDVCDWKLLDGFVNDLNDNGQITFESFGSDETQKKLKKLIKIAKALSEKYAAVVTNPPYMGASGMNAKLAAFVKKHYNDAKSDLFAVFMEKTDDLVKSFGFTALITMESWMFLSSFERIRMEVTDNKTIINMVHMPYLGKGGTSLGINFGTAAVVMMKGHIFDYSAQYEYTVYYECNIDGVPIAFPTYNSRWSTAKQENFSKIPGNPVAYWVDENVFKAFSEAMKLEQIADVKVGLQTGNNDRFLKLWFEVDYQNITFNANSDSDVYWVPHNKAGDFRKWYGNGAYIVNWKNNGREIKECTGSRPQNTKYYFMEGFSWSDVSSGAMSVRYWEKGCIFDTCAPTLFPRSKSWYLLGLLNTKIGQYIMDIMSPTIHYTAGSMMKFPVWMPENYEIIESLVEKNVLMAKDDWNEKETSWGFVKHPLFFDESGNLYDNWKILAERREHRFNSVKNNEVLLNKYFIELYGMQNCVDCSIDDDRITITKSNIEKDIESLISYAVGCMFGRYSLDEEGLVLAGQPFESHFFEASAPVCGTGFAGAPGASVPIGEFYYKTDDGVKKCTYNPDKDNIIPICDEEYFSDDIVSRFCEWVKIVYGEKSLETNLDFIAKALGNKGNTSREVIRNYFLNDFFKDHCNTYSVTGSGKRPIYWLFDSGKQNGFKALIYMHRYDADTVGRVRTDYLHKAQKYVETAMQSAQYTIDNATSASEKSKATKAVTKYTKQLAEMRIYDEAIAHVANQRIEIDLDDGVKVNYAKFQGVEVAQEGKKALKVDLLAKI